MRVAIADDDPELLEQLSAALEGASHSFDRYRNGAEMLTALKRETYDVVLIDWNMPGASGLEIVTWASANLSPPPAMILLTSRAGKEDVVRGLEAGAIDYIVKPESNEVILARIDAAMRKVRAREKPRFEQFGRYRIDRLQEIIEADGEPIKLTAKEFKVAELLFDNLNRPLSRNYIFAQVWNGSPDMETRTLDMHISRVRSKLELRPQNGFAIQTVFGFGYRMDDYDAGAEE
ncbi:response regulator transcription factor [Erythrobacter sp. SDW2]|uniref:response regulator transcription factor n=1 Tax=Erythrobacter sp. SDW2 TaxID=2907154 RepID=UPI001F350624|nr:response regulator transcription factor [Erythrobacter sp. SDW2]UIP06878.1 response regulator transcription factor [Erythrobacter sp. SDW2]